MKNDARNKGQTSTPPQEISSSSGEHKIVADDLLRKRLLADIQDVHERQLASGESTSAVVARLFPSRSDEGRALMVRAVDSLFPPKKEPRR